MVTTGADVSFSWGKRKGKGRGGTKKEVQFYESFTYDGVEYFLYDSVYLYKDGEQEPYIGKLIKVWEGVNQAKKVKILWFFYPSEISNYLEHEKVLENELFLASGDGVGLANVNPLEAIAGKCNVVCISKDERNRQPSDEELDMAKYVFYRTFDVGSLTISDNMGEQISSIEVGFLLNKKDVQLPNENHDIKIDNQNGIAVVEKPLILGKDVAEKSTALEPDVNMASSVKGEEEVHTDKSRSPLGTHDVAATELHPFSLEKEKGFGNHSALKEGLSKKRKLDGVLHSGSNGKKLKPDGRGSGSDNARNITVQSAAVSSDRNKALQPAETSGNGKLVIDSDGISNEMLKSHGREENKSSDKLFKSSLESGKGLEVKELVGTSDALSKKMKSHGVEVKSSLKLIKCLEVKELVGTSDALSKKMKSDGVEIKSSPKFGKGLEVKELGGTSDVLSKKIKSDCKEVKSSLKSGKGLEVKQHVGTSNALSKKMKSDGVEVKSSLKSGKDLVGKELVENALSKNMKSDGVVVKSNTKLNNGLPKRLKSDGVINDKSGDRLHKASLKQSKNMEIEAYGCIKEVTRRPSGDREKSWIGIEQRMEYSQQQGTLVLLQNLDPTYTSSEVEDIVFCAFGESCSAKMVQSTVTSSPRSGQAFVIFKGREAAQRVITKVNQECLILPNLRPLVAIRGTLSSEKQQSFPGHLSIDKLKQQQSHQAQRESKAVSTSHCSQPNTFEYDLALEWHLLQDRFDLCWRKLYKGHGEEYKRLKKDFQLKKG